MRYLLFFISAVLLIQSCYTPIKSKKILDEGKSENGIPYYLPMPYLVVKESIEIERTEKLYYAIRKQNSETFLLPVLMNTEDESNEKLVDFDKLEPSTNRDSTYVIYKKHNKTNSIEETWDVIKFDNKIESASTMREYKPTSIENSFQIIMLPDYKNKYELVICSGWFNSMDLKFKLVDGWRFDGLEAEISENKLISSLTEVTKSVIEAAQKIKVTQIEQESAIKLKEIESGFKSLNAQEDGKEKFEFLGYFKKIEIKTISPGIYKLLDSDNNFALPDTTKTDTYYVPFRF